MTGAGKTGRNKIRAPEWMMTRATVKRCLAIVLALSATAFSAKADEARPARGVVELFTSQGCSSCPPADKALEELARQGEVVALAYHVDYWNYRGWTDTLASKDNTERQYSYARMFGRTGVYTPQAVLNGREHMKGGNLKGIRERIEAMAAEGKGLDVPVSADIGSDEIRIRIGSGKGKANIVVVYFDRQRSVEIQKGENRGRTVSYWHAVTDMQTIGMWEGKETDLVLPVTMLARKKKNGGCAILLQRMRSADTPGAILGAAVLTPASAPM